MHQRSVRVGSAHTEIITVAHHHQISCNNVSIFGVRVVAFGPIVELGREMKGFCFRSQLGVSAPPSGEYRKAMFIFNE